MNARRLAVVILASVASFAALADDCGTERWDVKVGADSAARRVDLDHPQHATVDSLAALTRPEHVGNHMARMRGVEDRAFVVDAVLTLYRGEDDGDTHIVLRSLTGSVTMIAEIPSEECMPADSPFRAAVERVRAVFAQRFARRSERGLQVRVRITGPAFFDFLHRQTGLAPNGIEIHPITRLEFLH